MDIRLTVTSPVHGPARPVRRTTALTTVCACLRTDPNQRTGPVMPVCATGSLAMRLLQAASGAGLQKPSCRGHSGHAGDPAALRHTNPSKAIDVFWIIARFYCTGNQRISRLFVVGYYRSRGRDYITCIGGVWWWDVGTGIHCRVCWVSGLQPWIDNGVRLIPEVNGHRELINGKLYWNCVNLKCVSAEAMVCCK